MVDLGAAGIYRRLLGAQMRAQASYRSSFALDVATNALIPVLDVAAVLAMFKVTRSLGGFTASEVLVMLGLSATAFALANLLVGNIEKLRTYVRLGLLDAILVRPLSPLGQLLSLDFTIRRIASVGVALTVLVVAVARADVAWSPGRVALIAITPLAGALFFCAVFVGTASVAFWWIDSGEFANSFTYGGRDFTTYPITVYSGVFRWLFAYSLGFAFVGYYPATTLLGRTDPLGAPAWIGWGTPVVAVGASLAAGVVWRIGVRHYRSTGS